ncbi:hypothetical protein AOQ84DRAFT_384532, partial [Glonium stellatum]
MVDSKVTGGCWTCRERKIRCDKQIPFCQNCSRSKRQCKGYGLRLSWPRQGDQRRAICAQDPRSPEKSSKTLSDNHVRFLNVFTSDLNLYNKICGNNALSVISFGNSRIYPQYPRVQKGPSWLPSTLEEHRTTLLSYYEVVISKMVASVSSPQFRSLILRMSFADSSPSSCAVLQAIFALASVHLYGPSPAIAFKQKALLALEASLNEETGMREVLQRIAAAMLLGLYEIFDQPDSPYGWAQHICKAKMAVKGAYTLDTAYQGDLALILDWVYYHDVLSKFSVRHYKQRTIDQVTCAKDKYIMYKQLASPRKTMILGTFGCSLETLVTISQIFDVTIELDSCSTVSANTIDKLERRLKFARQELDIETLDDPEYLVQEQSLRDIAELYRLAGLLYLYRAAKKAPISHSSVTKFVSDAFEVIGRLQTCERVFPLFIVACEARTDAQRAEILRILANTWKTFRVGNVFRIQQLIERLWAQDDLDSENQLDYSLKITSVLSTGGALPAFT